MWQYIEPSFLWLKSVEHPPCDFNVNWLFDSLGMMVIFIIIIAVVVFLVYYLKSIYSSEHKNKEKKVIESETAVDNIGDRTTAIEEKSFRRLSSVGGEDMPIDKTIEQKMQFSVRAKEHGNLKKLKKKELEAKSSVGKLIQFNKPKHGKSSIAASKSPTQSTVSSSPKRKLEKKTNVDSRIQFNRPQLGKASIGFERNTKEPSVSQVPNQLNKNVSVERKRASPLMRTKIKKLGPETKKKNHPSI